MFNQMKKNFGLKCDEYDLEEGYRFRVDLQE